MILFIIVYVISVILIWIYVHIDPLNEHKNIDYSDKLSILCLNFIPIVNTVFCFSLIIILPILLIGKCLSKLNIKFDDFYKLKK